MTTFNNRFYPRDIWQTDIKYQEVLFTPCTRLYQAVNNIKSQLVDVQFISKVSTQHTLHTCFSKD